MTHSEKLEFLKTGFPALLKNLASDAKGQWGVMNGQQMVEHMADSVSQATGNNNQKLHTAEENLERMKNFAMSDKEFRPNTPNALLPDVPPPHAKESMTVAIEEYNRQIRDFIAYFEKNPGARIMNPFFGNLNFEEWTQLLHKHAIHHSKQFGLL